MGPQIRGDQPNLAAAMGADRPVLRLRSRGSAPFLRRRLRSASVLPCTAIASRALVRSEAAQAAKPRCNACVSSKRNKSLRTRNAVGERQKPAQPIQGRPRFPRRSPSRPLRTPRQPALPATPRLEDRPLGNLVVSNNLHMMSRSLKDVL